MRLDKTNIKILLEVRADSDILDETKSSIVFNTFRLIARLTRTINLLINNESY